MVHARERVARWVEYAGGGLSPEGQRRVERELALHVPDAARRAEVLARLRRVASSREPFRDGPAAAASGPVAEMELSSETRRTVEGRDESVRRYAAAGFRLEAIVTLAAPSEARVRGRLFQGEAEVAGPIVLARNAGASLAELGNDASGGFVFSCRVPERVYLVVGSRWLALRL